MYSASYKASVNEKFTVKESFPHIRHKVGDINDDQNKVKIDGHKENDTETWKPEVKLTSDSDYSMW